VSLRAPREPEAQVDSTGRYEDRLAFERAIEGRYRKPGEYEHLTILAYVDAERDELVPAFWAWRSVGKRDGRIGDLARQWERERFGDELYTSAHQVLVFAIYQSLTPEQRPSRYGRIKPGLTNQQRKESLNEALDAITRDKGMEREETPA